MGSSLETKVWAVRVDAVLPRFWSIPGHRAVSTLCPFSSVCSSWVSFLPQNRSGLQHGPPPSWCGGPGDSGVGALARVQVTNKQGREAESSEVGAAVLWSLSCVWLPVTRWTVTHQAPLSMGSPRQRYWSGLPFFSPGDLPNPGIESKTPMVAGGFLTTEPS